MAEKIELDRDEVLRVLGYLEEIVPSLGRLGSYSNAVEPEEYRRAASDFLEEWRVCRKLIAIRSLLSAQFPYNELIERFGDSPSWNPSMRKPPATHDGKGIHCILCGNILATSVFADTSLKERPLTLVCAAHRDQDLSDEGLTDLWGGYPYASLSPSFFEDKTAKVTEVWEQGEGHIAIYALLDDGDLIMFLSWGGDDEVFVARVPRAKRALERPQGIPLCTRQPWRTAVAQGWIMQSVRRIEDGQVEVSFPNHGELTFSTYLASWGELGDGRRFLTEDWRPSEE